jgi:cytoskeleton protein RodZ
MNEQVMQDSLFQDPLGERLRVAREKAGMTRGQVAAQLRLPSAVVEAMEREDWGRLGASIYVRSYVGSYLRLLGLPESLLELATPEKKISPPLVTLATRSRMRHTLDTSVRNLVYLVMTAVLVVPVVLVARHYQARDRVQDLTLDPGAAADRALAMPAPATTRAPVVPKPLPEAAPAGGDPLAAAALDIEAPAHEPVMASMAPFPNAAPAGGLVLRFRGESWIDVVDGDGARVERGLVPAGAERRYDAGEVARITLGNADGVDVSHSGRDVDLTPYRSANVARFAVSSDGAPAPAAN